MRLTVVRWPVARGRSGRPEFGACGGTRTEQWGMRIFVSTALEKTVDRAVIRERRVSCPVEVERRWRERYIPSRQFYFATVRPTDHANIIVHNDEP